MAAFPSPERLARVATRHPWRVIATWGVLFVAAVALTSTIGSVLTTAAENYIQTDADHGNDLLAERLLGQVPGREIIYVRSDSKDVDDPAFKQMLSGLQAEIGGLKDDIRSVTSYAETNDASLVSKDRRATILPVTLTGDRLESDKHIKPLLALLEARNGKDGYTVLTGGDGSISEAFTKTSESDLQSAEVIGMPIALVVLALVFGALVAAGIPVLLGLFAILVGLGITAAVGQVFELSIFVTNMITMMGLAVGIDYSLLVIQRFREEREKGLDRDAAIIKAGGTASRAVLFSGMAVVVALSGLIIVPHSIFRSLGAGAIIVVVVAVAAALTLLPAVLRLLGDRVNKVPIRIPGITRKHAPGSSHRGFWDRTTGVVMAHPIVSVILSVGLLVALAAPYFTIELGWSGVSLLPEKSEARQAYDLIGRDFSAGEVAPANIVVDSAGLPAADVASAAEKLAAAIKADGRFGAVSITKNDQNTLTVISSPINADPNGTLAQDAARTLRESYVPAAFGSIASHVFVTGATAEGIDNTGVIDGHTFPVFAWVLGLSFVILLVVFRSIVVPIKALVMNLLSVGAAYGLMVLVFQHGYGHTLLGFTKVDTIETWVPLFMFAVLFGLSMDYHVFLLTRIRERFDHTRNNKESVAFGVRTTAGMITGAALIMVAVFSGFALGELVMFQQMGFGLAVAVFLDATVVRTVLVPASMELLGDANWYLPSWLNWLPRVDIEGASAEREPSGRLPEGAVGQ